MFSFEIKASEDFDKEIDHSIVASLLYGSVFIHKTFNVEMNQMGVTAEKKYYWYLLLGSVRCQVNLFTTYFCFDKIFFKILVVQQFREDTHVPKVMSSNPNGWTFILSYFFFKNGPSPASFSFIFGLFQTNINTILQQINVKKCPSSMRHWDSNPRPSERESPPITTRPGLPALQYKVKIEQYRQENWCISYFLNKFGPSQASVLFTFGLCQTNSTIFTTR